MIKASGIKLRYKFLAAQGLTLALAVVGLGLLTGKAFYDDKRLFIRDYTLTLLEIANSAAALQLKLQTDELESLTQNVPTVIGGGAIPEPKLSSRLERSLLRFSYLSVADDGHLWPAGSFIHNSALRNLRVPANFVTSIDGIPAQAPAFGSGTRIMNRTPPRASNAPTPVTVLTVIIELPTKNKDRHLLVADLDGAFLVRALGQSEFTEMFLLAQEGDLVSSSDPGMVVDFGRTKFPHPIVGRLADISAQAENIRVEWKGEPYYVSYGRTGLPGIFVGAQVRQADAFSVFSNLLVQLSASAAIIIYVSLMVSIVMSSHLTKGLARLREAAIRVGRGNFDVTLPVESHDEIGLVADSFNTMTQQVKRLLVEANEKARMQGELRDASLLQTTLLSNRALAVDGLDISWHYTSATECSGDFWDAFVDGNVVTLIIADVTGHGLPSAIVTGVAKGSLSMMNTLVATKPIPPSAYLSHLNRVIYSACEGRLLMTMAVVQLDMRTGKAIVANAGHEFPLLFRQNQGLLNLEKPMRAVEEVIIRGERLGFSPQAKFESTTIQLEAGDAVLLYTDGLSEGQNPEGAPWGARALRRAFGEGSVEQGDASAITSRIMQNFESFTRSAPKKDDVTFVVVRHSDSGASRQAA